jgi:hypothetical protein
VLRLDDITSEAESARAKLLASSGSTIAFDRQTHG